MKEFCLLNTRPEPQASHFEEKMCKEGISCLTLPSLAIKSLPMDKTLLEDLVKTSSLYEKNIVLFMSQPAALLGLSWIKKMRGYAIGAVGEATAEVLKKSGVNVDIVPENFSSEGILSCPEFSNLSGKRIIIFRGQEGRVLLDNVFKERGADVQEVLLYKRCFLPWSQEQIQQLRMALFPNIKLKAVLGLSRESIDAILRQVNTIEFQKEYAILLSLPWLVMSERVEKHAYSCGIKHTVTIKHNQIFQALNLLASTYKY